MNKTTSLILICILFYIFIPFFLLPVTTVFRFIILNAFWVYLLVNLILQKKVGIGNEQFNKYPDKFSFFSFIKNHKILFILLLINFIIHIYPIASRSILLGGDECTLVQSGLGLYTRISSIFQKLFKVELFYVTRIFYVVLLFLTILLRKKLVVFIKKVNNSINQHIFTKITFILMLIFISYVYFFFIKNVSFHGSLYRYPPMSKFLYFITYTIFGITEIAPRLIQVILGSIGVIYLYRLILLFYNKHTAILGVIIFIFNPLISYYFNYAELGLGTISITIIISFYFVRFLKYNYDNDLLLTFFLIGIGFLYKRAILLLLILVPFCLIISNFKYFKTNKNKLLKLIWLSLIPIIPFLTIGKFFSTPYLMSFSRLFNKYLFSYFIFLNTQISWLIFLLFLVSSIFIVIKERNKLITFMVFYFLGFYLLYTLYPWDTINRFSLAFIPIIAIFSAIFISKILHTRKVILNIITILIGIYLISISTFIKLPEIQPKFVLYKNFLLEHYPTDKAIKWIKNNHNNYNILSLEVRNIAFYRDKFNIMKDKIIAMPVEEFNEHCKDEIDNFIKDNNISCIMVSNGRGHYKKENINLEKISSLREFKYKNGNKITLYLGVNN